MGKYIVELKKNETLYKAATRESDGTAYVCSAIGTPYTEPDLEQVRKEAYKEGREVGIKDGMCEAWEAARKIGSNSMCSLEEMGFDFSQCAVDDYNPSWFVVKNYYASECIEKIRAYEKEKEMDGLRQNIQTIVDQCGYSLDEIAEVLQKMKES